MALVALLATALGSCPALATGICEHTTTTYELRAVSDAAGELLVTGEAEWCEETEDVTERRGTEPFLQVWDLGGRLLRRSLLPPPADKKPGPSTGPRVGAAANSSADVPKARWQQAGFADVAAVLDSPSGRCTLRVQIGERLEPERDFPTASAHAELVLEGEVIKRLALGGFAVDEGAPVVTPLYLPGRRALVLWAALPRCVGGPPPGYFGEDDPGDCYTGGKPEVHLVELAHAPGLAACFAPGAPPAKPGGAATPGPAWATLREGAVQAQGRPSKSHGRRPEVQVRRLWAPSAGSPDYRAVVRDKLGKGALTTVQVPGTAYSVLLHAGVVQPLLLCNKPWGLWQLDGLGPFFQRAAKVLPGDRTVTVRGVRGMVDLDLIWVLDLSDPKAGLVVRYDEEGGW